MPKVSKQRRTKRVKDLFRRSVKNKRGDHWLLCLASNYVVGLRDGSTERLASDADVSVDSVEDYARTYRLYVDIRAFFLDLKREGIEENSSNVYAVVTYEKAYRQIVFDLRELRRELHYTKWLIVANAVYTGFKTKDGRKKLSYPEALDALKSGADGIGTELFAALVAGSEISRAKAYKRAVRALQSVLSYPLPKRKRQAIKKAYIIIDKEQKT